MRYRRFVPWMLAGAAGLVLASCSEDRAVITAPDVFLAAGDAPPAFGFVTGSGHYTPASGGLRTFSFTVRRMPNGNVTGRFAGVAHLTTIQWSGRLICLVIDGNTAWIGGVYEHSTNAALIGTGFVFKVKDVGEGHGWDPDTTSRAMRGGSDCTIKPEPAPEFWYPVERGNIQVRP